MRLNRKLLTVGACVTALCSLGVLPAAAFEVDFNLAHGTVVKHQYDSPEFGHLIIGAASGGVSPTASNAVVFGPRSRNRNPRPRGLPAPGGSGLGPLSGLPGSESSVLVVQASDRDCRGNRCRPEGSGFLVFDFAAPVNLERLDVQGFGRRTAEARVAFFLDGGASLPSSLTNLDLQATADSYFDFGAAPTGGGRPADGRYFFGDAGMANVRTMVVSLDGGGVTGLRAQGPAIPEPGTLLLLGAGILGLAGWGRRRALPWRGTPAAVTA